MIVPGHPGLSESPLVSSLDIEGKVSTPSYITNLMEIQKRFKGGYVGGPRMVGLSGVGGGCTQKQNGGMGCSKCSGLGLGDISSTFSSILLLVGAWWTLTALKGNIKI